MKEKLKNKPRLANKKELFHWDNAPSHKSIIAMTKLWIGFRIDSSYTLFFGFGLVRLLAVPKFKNLTQWENIFIEWGNHCCQWIFCRLRAYFSDGIKKLEICWTKCIALIKIMLRSKGDFFQKNMFYLFSFLSDLSNNSCTWYV